MPSRINVAKKPSGFLGPLVYLLSMSKCDQERKNINLESLNERVRNAGMKLTQQRHQMLKILLNHPEPISADEIFKKFDNKSAGMDLVTIYRILKNLKRPNWFRVWNLAMASPVLSWPLSQDITIITSFAATANA